MNLSWPTFKCLHSFLMVQFPRKLPPFWSDLVSDPVSHRDPRINEHPFIFFAELPISRLHVQQIIGLVLGFTGNYVFFLFKHEIYCFFSPVSTFPFNQSNGWYMFICNVYFLLIYGLYFVFLRIIHRYKNPQTITR